MMKLRRTMAVMLIATIGMVAGAQEPRLKTPVPAAPTSTVQRPETSDPIAVPTTDIGADTAKATAASLLLEIVKDFEDEAVEATVDREKLLDEVSKIVQRKLNATTPAPPATSAPQAATTPPLKLPLASSIVAPGSPGAQQKSATSVNKPVVPSTLPATGTLASGQPVGNSYVIPASNTLPHGVAAPAVSSIESRLLKLEQEVSELKRWLLKNQPVVP